MNHHCRDDRNAHTVKPFVCEVIVIYAGRAKLVKDKAHNAEHIPIKVDNYMTLVVTLRKVPAELFTPKELTSGVNIYWIDEHFTGVARKFLTELLAAMKGEKWYDRSNAMIDYFDTAWYNDIKIGEYGKPVEII